MVRFFFTFFLFLLPVINLQAKDFGKFGNSFPIIEEDLLKIIGYRLAELQSSGKIDTYSKAIKAQTELHIQRPKAVNLQEAKHFRTFYYDPTYIVKEDIRDLEGNLIAKAGTKVNPFDTVTLSKPLVFLDGDNKNQLAWLDKTRKSYKKLTIILTKGEPIKLSEELQEEIFFDQQGLITTKLKIEHIPAIVTQENKWLKIEEIKLEDNN